MKWYIQNQIMISDDGTRIISVADDICGICLIAGYVEESVKEPFN